MFDLPKDARGVKGGRRQGDEEEGRSAESLFEIRCIVNIKLAMGIGRYFPLFFIACSHSDERYHELVRIFN